MPRAPKKRGSAAVRARNAAANGASAARGKAVTGCPLAALTRKYAKLVNASKPWTWKLLGNPTLSQQSKIRAMARLKKLVPVIKVDAKGFPKFPKKFIKEDNTKLPKKLWKAKDKAQFRWLNNDLAKRNKNYDPKTQTFKNDPKKRKYTWHHHQDNGRMQLVEFGAHNSTPHNGGRTTWATGPR
jgi:hypothetical protein